MLGTSSKVLYWNESIKTEQANSRKEMNPENFTSKNFSKNAFFSFKRM